MSATDIDPAVEKAARARELVEQASLPYSWKQTISDLDVTVPVPAGTRARDLAIVIGTNKLTVGLKGQEPIMEVRGWRYPLLRLSAS